jgi:hypothetical protein
MRFVLLTLAVLTGACGGFPKPEARITSSEAAIRGAKEAGASNVPNATLHLKLAEEQREKAMALVKDGDNEKADYLLMRSEADAELANALAREASAKAETAKTQEQVEKLKKKAGSK